MRGYFGIGAEDISKPMNLGALMRTAGWLATISIFLAACDARDAPTPTASGATLEAPQAAMFSEALDLESTTATNRPCSAEVYQILDAIHFACDDGRGFTVHYEEVSWCAVVSAGGTTYILPQTVASPTLNTDGHVEFRPDRDRATLNGAAGGPYENCKLVE